MPYRGGQTNHIQNGILLRSDIHLSFDLGLITFIADTYKIKVNSTLQESGYFELHDKDLSLSNNPNNHPNRDALRHHNENEFKE
jgi:putative restriction endonuclease